MNPSILGFTAFLYTQNNPINRIDPSGLSDSISGIIGYTYDTGGCPSCSGVDRISQETTPLGTINYTYNANGRRASMTVAGEPVVNYGYDDVGRLTGISRSCCVDKSTVNDTVNRAIATGLSWPFPFDLEQRLYPPAVSPASRKLAQPDWRSLHDELIKHKKLTLMLLWQQYKE